MKKIITLLLSSILVIATLLSGCGVDYRAPNSSFGVESGEDSSVEETPAGDCYTVRLQTSDGSRWSSLAGLYAVWTDKTGADMYKASFDKDGVAVCYEPDGEYYVTLSGLPTGYTYNPNAYEANNDAKETVVKLYPLRSLTGGDGGVSPDHFQIKQAGAYRFTFEKETDEFYFTFSGTSSGKISLQTLIDITTNELSPTLYECFGTHLPKVRKEITGGGASNTFTKNIYCEYNLTGSQEMLFKTGVETAKEGLYPVTVDLLIEQNEYEGDYSNLTEMPKPVLDLPEALKELYINEAGEETWRAKITPVGKTFVSLANYTRGSFSANRNFDVSLIAFDEETGLYYFNKNYAKPDAEPTPDKKYPLYAVLKRDVPGLNTTDLGGVHNLGLSYKDSYHLCTNSRRDYTKFISAYMERCSTDGSYPVDKNLETYLNDVSITRNIFFDGHGTAELGGNWGDFPSGSYYADSASRWLFACGIYW